MDKNVEFNNEKCIGCFKCREVCPFNVIEYIDGKPKLNPNKACLKCMHCAAACPVEAITYNGKKAAFDSEFAEFPENFLDLLEVHVKKRRSYRHFKKEPVNRGFLEHALEIACWAPSAKNEHLTKYIVVDTKEIIDKIMNIILGFAEKNQGLDIIVKEYQEGNNPIMGNAPTLLLAYSPNKAINPVGDGAIKLCTVELLLQAQGVGSCWAGYLTRLSNAIPELRELFNVPEGNSFVGALMLGYPDYDAEYYGRIPERIKKQEIKWI